MFEEGIKNIGYPVNEPDKVIINGIEHEIEYTDDPMYVKIAGVTFIRQSDHDNHRGYRLVMKN